MGTSATGRTLRLALAALCCGVAIAACGSSSKSDSSPTGSSEALKLADCMRAHGVPDFPDPTPGGGGVNLAGTGINAKSPAFQSARQKCANLSPKGKPGGIEATESQFTAALRFAECMRAHGFPNFPDPIRSDSPPGPIFIVGPGLFFRVSQSFDPSSPLVARAGAHCGLH